MPLTFTWVMMSCEGPLLTALIARLPNEKYNLAAFGVTWAIALLVEAPVIPILSTTAALLSDFGAYQKIKRFIYSLNLLTTLMMLVVSIPAVFSFIAYKILSLEPEIATRAHAAFTWMLPWPAAIGYRRFYQGVLIRHNRTDRVAKGTIIRLSSLALTAFGLFKFSGLDGASIGGISLAAAVTLEGVASRIMAEPVLKQFYQSAPSSSQSASSLSYASLIRFYIPLTLTIIIGIGMGPISTFAVSHSERSLDSLAVLPVLNAFLFLIQSLALGIQETVIVLCGDKFENIGILRRFAKRIAYFLVGALFVVYITPLAHLWFSGVAGLSEELSFLTCSAFAIAIPLPLMNVSNSFLQAILMKAKRTPSITHSTLLQCFMLCLTLYITVWHFHFVGAYAAPLATLTSSLAAVLFLYLALKRAPLAEN